MFDFDFLFGGFGEEGFDDFIDFGVGRVGDGFVGVPGDFDSEFFDLFSGEFADGFEVGFLGGVDECGVLGFVEVLFDDGNGASRIFSDGFAFLFSESTGDTAEDECAGFGEEVGRGFDLLFEGGTGFFGADHEAFQNGHFSAFDCGDGVVHFLNFIGECLVGIVKDARGGLDGAECYFSVHDVLLLGGNENDQGVNGLLMGRKVAARDGGFARDHRAAPSLVSRPALRPQRPVDLNYGR